MVFCSNGRRRMVKFVDTVFLVRFVSLRHHDLIDRARLSAYLTFGFVVCELHKLKAVVTKHGSGQVLNFADCFCNQIHQLACWLVAESYPLRENYNSLVHAVKHRNVRLIRCVQFFVRFIDVDQQHPYNANDAKKDHCDG